MINFFLNFLAKQIPNPQLPQFKIKTNRGDENFTPEAGCLISIMLLVAR